MSNADLALEFLKKCQKCRESGVPNDMAILAALQDIADYKDKEWTEKSQEMGVRSLLILDHDEIIGDSSQEIDGNLMDYVSNLRQRINYTNEDIN